MIQVAPVRVRLSRDGSAGVLILKARESESGCELAISMTQARDLLAEINRIATDRCGNHHIATSIVRAFGARAARFVLHEEKPGWFSARLELAQNVDEGDDILLNVDVDVIAGISLAVHVGLPMFVEACPGGAMREMGDLEAGPRAAGGDATEVPRVFEEALESILDERPEDEPPPSL